MSSTGGGCCSCRNIVKVVRSDEMVDVVGPQRHLVGLRQTLAVDWGRGGVAGVGVAQLGGGGGQTAATTLGVTLAGGSSGMGVAHLQGSGVVVDRYRGGGVDWLSPSHHTHRLEYVIIKSLKTQTDSKLVTIKGKIFRYDIRNCKHKWLMCCVCFSIQTHYRRIGLKLPNITHHTG